MKLTTSRLSITASIKNGGTPRKTMGGVLKNHNVWPDLHTLLNLEWVVSCPRMADPRYHRFETSPVCRLNQSSSVLNS